MSQEIDHLNKDLFSPCDLKKKLQNLYRSQIEIPKLIEIDEEKLRQTWDEHYIELKLLSRQKPKDDTNNEMEETKEYQLENIFDSDNSSKICKVLFLGVGGAGKSTLLHYITYKWGKDELWGDRFDIVFRIRLKHLLNSKWKTNYDEERQLKRDKFACFIHHNLKLQCFNLEKDNIETLEEPQVSVDDIFDLVNKERVLLIVDGYNEVSHLTSRKDKEFQEILNAINQYKYTIISSRPNAFKINDMDSFDRLLEIKSLDLEKVMKYINSFHGNDDDLNASLTLFLERNNQIRGICEIPINMVLLCLIWGDENIKETFQNNFDVNIQLLYHEVILWLGKKYLVTFDNWEPKNIVPSTVFEQEIILFLQKIAFDSFSEQGNFVNNKLIKKHLGKLNIGNIYKFGILTVVGFTNDIVNLEYQFIHPTFQEFLTALHLNNKLASNDGKEITYSCNLIGRHRNEPKYLMVLKFLAGIVSSKQFSDEEECKDRLVQRTWLAFTCNVDGVLELGLDSKLTLLMHLLEQSKVKGKYDERIPNLNEIITFIDTEVVVNVTKWQRQIIESGYISKGIQEKLEVVFDDNDIANQDKLELRVAIEIFTNLVNKSEFGGKQYVLKRITKVLSFQNWQLQRLTIEKFKQLVDSNVDECFLKNELELINPLIGNRDLNEFPVDLLVKIVSLFPNLISNVFNYIKLVIDFRDFKFASSAVNFVSRSLQQISKNDEVANIIFEMLKVLFLQLKFNYIFHSEIIKGLLNVIKRIPTEQLPDKVDQFYVFLKDIILNFKLEISYHQTAVFCIIDLFTFVPDCKIMKMVDEIFTIFEKVLKSSESNIFFKRVVISSFPKLINIVLGDQITKTVIRTFKIFEGLLAAQQTSGDVKTELFKNLSNLLKLLTHENKLEIFSKCLVIVKKFIEKESAEMKRPKYSAIRFIKQLVSSVFDDDFQPTLELYEIMEKIIKNTNDNEDFREVTVHGLLQLVECAPQSEKVKLLDRVTKLFSQIVSNRDGNYIKREILNTLSRFVAVAPEANIQDKLQEALIFLDTLPNSNEEVLHVKIPALCAALTLSVNPVLLETDKTNLSNRISQMLDELKQLFQHYIDYPELTYKAINDVLCTNLIPCLQHLSEEQKVEKANLVFHFLEDIMKSSNVDLSHKWSTSAIVEELITNLSETEASGKLDKIYELLQPAILESADEQTKVVVLSSLSLLYPETVKLASRGIFKIFNAVLNDSKIDLNIKYVTVAGIMQLYEDVPGLVVDQLLLKTAFEILHTASESANNDVMSKLVTVQNLTRLVKAMPKEQVHEIAGEAIKIFMSLIIRKKCTSTIGTPALNGIKSVLEVTQENKEILLDAVLEKLIIVILAYKDYGNGGLVVVRGLPKFVKEVEGCGNKILTLLHTVIKIESDNYLQAEARKSIALLVEYCSGADQCELAKKAFDILASDNFNKYLADDNIECVTKITKAMVLGESVKLLHSDVGCITEGAKKGILMRLTAMDEFYNTDYKQIESLLRILEICKEQKEIIDKELYAAVIGVINKTMENIGEDGIKWVIDNFTILTNFDEIKIAVKSLYRKLLGKVTEKNETISQNINDFFVQCVKFGLVTTIQRNLINSKQYQIKFEDVSFIIDDTEGLNLNNIINTALQLDNQLAKQCREWEPIFKNSGSSFGLPVAAFDFKICSLINQNCILDSESWCLSLLHLSDQNKNEPTAVFALIERRNHFGYHLIYKIHVENQKLRVASFEQHPHQINTEFCTEIFGQMHYDFLKLIKPRYYVSLNYPILLKEGEILIESLQNPNKLENNDEYEILHQHFQEYFDNILWDEYKIGHDVIEIKKDFLLKLNTSHSDEARRFSQIIDKLTAGDEMKEQQKELEEKIIALEEELRENGTANQEDKTKIQQILDKLKSLEKMNSEQRQRIVHMTQSIHLLLSEGELTAEWIMSLEQQCEWLQNSNTRIQTISAQIPQLNGPNINYCGGEETSNDDCEYYFR